MNLKAEEEAHPDGQSRTGRSEESLPEPPKEYEQLLQKLEAEVRSHIRVEQQLKLHIETQQFQLDDLEKCKREQALQLKQLQEALMLINIC